MRRLRRELGDVEERSDRIRIALESIPEVRAAHIVMAYTAIPGEPDLAKFVTGCWARGQVVVMPEDEPSPGTVDVVVVPGLAFTADGHRLGQGGGWYDRFLADVDHRCVTIGVCFAEPVVSELPRESHDVILDRLVTDAAIGPGHASH